VGFADRHLKGARTSGTWNTEHGAWHMGTKGIQMKGDFSAPFGLLRISMGKPQSAVDRA